MLTRKEVTADSVQRVSSKVIALVILLIVLLFSYGCNQIDTHACFLDAEEKAGESPVIRYPDLDNCFIYIDKNSNIHTRCYNILDEMELRKDMVLFNYNEYMKLKNGEVEK